MGGLSRRFLNVIVDNQIAGVQTLRCIDLMRHKLFNTTTPRNGGQRVVQQERTPPNGRNNGMKQQDKQQALQPDDMLPLASPMPSPWFSMRASTTGQGMHCCPAPADRAVLCLDKWSGRNLLLEADTSRVVMMPCLHRPKLDPISLYIPGLDCTADSERDPLEDVMPAPSDAGAGGTFFIMDRVAKHKEATSCQSFEALVYRNPFRLFLPAKVWGCDLLPPPPPYIDNTRRNSCLEITSYAVINHNNICISVDGSGTYCCDTKTLRWSQVGNWTLPFRGKVEYVPDMNLWFGFSYKDQHFAAADLSTMDTEDPNQPQLLDSWKELTEAPKGWKQIQDPQLVNLGSGRFCIASFLHTETGTPNSTGSGDESISCDQNNNATVLTGVEVTTHGFNNQVNLQMLKHKMRCHSSSDGEDTIVAVL